MQFNNIIGNPPYNNYENYRFMMDAQDLCKNTHSFIIPTKIFNTDTLYNKENKIRTELLQHIDKMINFDNIKDVFDINCIRGVCYYTTTKNKQQYVKVKNINKNHNIQSNYEIHDINNFNALKLNVLNILNKVKGLNNTLIKRNYRFKVSYCVMLAGALNYKIDNTLLGLGELRIHTKNYNEDLYTIIKTFETFEEALNFCKFQHLNLAAFNFAFASNSINLNSCKKNIIDVLDYKHEYTNNDLYKLYNITEEEIQLIEGSVKTSNKIKIIRDWEDV